MGTSPGSKQLDEGGHAPPALSQLPVGPEQVGAAGGAGGTQGDAGRVQADPAFREAFSALGEAPCGASCAKLAREGNETARELFHQIGGYLGRGIACYTNILDPEAVFIGGGVSASLDLLLPGIHSAIEKYTFAQMKDVKILPTALGYEAALMGAIAIAL